jgi:predicted nucleic acid-binding protein
MGLQREIFSKACILEAVFHEVVVKGPNKPGSEVIRDSRWIETIPIKDRIQAGLLMVSLEMGEAEVLVPA